MHDGSGSDPATATVRGAADLTGQVSYAKVSTLTDSSPSPSVSEKAILETLETIRDLLVRGCIRITVDVINKGTLDATMRVTGYQDPPTPP